MKNIIALAFFMAALGSTTNTASAKELVGDTRLACEAILCLSSGTRPSECMPSLSKYFSISKKKLKDTLRARLNFLQLCPVSNQTPQMQSLVSGIAHGAGRCDARSLNLTLKRWIDGVIYIGNQLPDYCAAYTDHSYTDFTSSGTLPRYVGIPKRKGLWVEARDYDRALAEYNERIRREDEEQRLKDEKKKINR